MVIVFFFLRFSKISISYMEEKSKNPAFWTFFLIATNLFISWTFPSELRESRLGKPSEVPN